MSASRLLGVISGILCGSLLTAFAPYQPPKNFKSLIVPHEVTMRVELTHPSRENLPGFDESVVIKRDDRTGEVRLLTGVLSAHVVASRDSQDFVNEALMFIRSHSDLFNIDVENLALQQDAILMDEDVQFLKFKLMRDGIAIEDSSVDFRFKQGVLVQISNQSFVEAEPPPPHRPPPGDEFPFVEVARKNLANKLGLMDLPQFEGSSFRVSATKKGYQLIKVYTFKGAAPGYPSLTIQQQASGKIFELKDNNFHLQGEAKADNYPRWYDDAKQESKLDFVKIKADSLEVMTSIDGVFEASPDKIPSIENGLRGKYVQVETVSGTLIQRNAEKLRDIWSLHVAHDPLPANKHMDKDMAQTMIYLHTSRVVQKALQYINNPWLQRPLTANANLNSSCNAHWDGRTINLYSGSAQCANTGLIADVVYHEWGHGLDANTGGIEDGAFSEGFGDIISLIMTRSNQLGIGFHFPSRAPVRDLEPDKIYPRDKGEVHSEGLIIGSTFWDLFKVLKDKHGEAQAVELLSKYAFKVIYTAKTYLDVYDALLVIDDDNANPADGSPNGCIINQAFTAHGLATEDVSCKLAAVDRIQIRDQDQDGVIEPGELVQLLPFATNRSRQAIHDLTGEFSTTSPFVTVKDSQLFWKELPINVATVSERAAVIQVASDAPCGATFQAKTHLKAQTREAISIHSFVLGKNTGHLDVFSVSGLPVAIPDNETTALEWNVAGDQWANGALIHEAVLKFHINHTYVGDLTLSLIEPSGNRIQVYQGQGSGDNVDFNKNISDLIGQHAGAGAWKLEIKDTAIRDEGEITSFGLELTPKIFVCQ